MVFISFKEYCLQLFIITGLKPSPPEKGKSFPFLKIIYSLIETVFSGLIEHNIKLMSEFGFTVKK